MATVMVSIPDEFLKHVDKQAANESRSRSELVRQALREYMTNPIMDFRKGKQ